MTLAHGRPEQPSAWILRRSDADKSVLVLRRCGARYRRRRAPGLGPAATIAMLLPITLKMDHTTAIIALAGIFYGARYGGSTTSILLNMPGESSSVATCLDGYQMARNGRAGAALGISAIASFIAGTVGVLGLMLITPPLARFALRFAPPAVPKEVITYWKGVFDAFVKTPSWKQYIDQNQFEDAALKGPALSKFFDALTDQMREVLKEAGAKVVR